MRQQKGWAFLTTTYNLCELQDSTERRMAKLAARLTATAAALGVRVQTSHKKL